MVEAACRGDVAPGCPSPSFPVCRNGRWICVGQAVGAATAGGIVVSPGEDDPATWFRWRQLSGPLGVATKWKVYAPLPGSISFQ